MSPRLLPGGGRAPAPRSGWRLIATLAVAVAALGAQASTTHEARRYVFSHAEHAARDPASTCTDCHDASGAAPAGAVAAGTLGPWAPTAGRPALKTAHCTECHDEVPALAAREGRAALAVLFDHRPHKDAVAGKCASCHVRGASDDERHVEHRLAAEPSMCFSCHQGSADAPREQACVMCHGRDQRQVEPRTHDALAWKRMHGASAMPFAPLPHGQSCVLCHRESSCKSCHRVEAPTDHTPVWEERTHGIVASFNRARCKTCHETGQCVGCHRTTEPKNHDASWKATHGLVARSRSDSSCQVCHRPSFCIDCHRGNK